MKNIIKIILPLSWYRKLKGWLVKPYKRIKFVGLSISYRKIRLRLRKQFGKEQIRVGFIGYADGASCDIFTNLYKIFDHDSRFTCKVIILPYTHDDKNAMIKKHKNAMEYVRSQDIQPLPGYDEKNDVMINYGGSFDIVFFENEYDWIDPLFKVENFRDALSFVIPYGQYLADNVQYHLSHKMMSEVFRVYPTSKPISKMMKKYSDIFGWNINSEYLGNPKTDRFFNVGKVEDVWKKAKEGQKRIIWAPHHTWAPYSNFLTYYNDFLEYARVHKDIFIALKPHPALRDSLRDINKWSEEEIKQYFDAWKNGENTDLFEGAWFDLFQKSDAMVLDSLGFMLEYSLSGRPACVIYRVDENGNRVMKFSDCGEELYEKLYHAKDMQEIENFLAMIRRGEDNQKEVRLEYIKDNYTPPYGKSGAENIYNDILKMLE